MKDHDQSEMRAAREEAIEWLMRIEEHPLDPDDAEKFDAWLSSNPLHGAAFASARNLFQASATALAASPDETRRALKPRRRRGAGIAAGMIFLLAGGFWAYDGPLRLQADAMTNANENRTITLADGSVVRLNASSAIKESFGPAERKVQLLRGEAYFEIESEPGRPFVVEAGGGQIRVLGTAFNVNMTAAETEVTVTQHTVEISVPSQPKLAVHDGERTAYDDAGRIGNVETVEPDRAVPWLAGRLVFEEQPLERVVEQLGRHLPGTVVVARDSLRKRRISGSFDLKDPRSALDGFGIAFGVEIARVGPLMTIIY